jgi:acyl carrier protein
MSDPRPIQRPDSREAFARVLIEFIKGPLFARHGGRPIDLDGSTPLFETGIIDSLGIIDLLAFVEMATGRTVPTRMVDMRFFGTVDRICGAFWHETERP